MNTKSLASAVAAAVSANAGDAIRTATAYAATLDAATASPATMCSAILSDVAERACDALARDCSSMAGAKRTALVLSMAAHVQRDAIAAFKAERAKIAADKARGIANKTKVSYPKSISAYTQIRETSGPNKLDLPFAVSQVSAKRDGEGYETCRKGDVYFVASERAAKPATGEGSDAADVRESSDDKTAEMCMKILRAKLKLATKRNDVTLDALLAMIDAIPAAPAKPAKRDTTNTHAPRAAVLKAGPRAAVAKVAKRRAA